MKALLYISVFLTLLTSCEYRTPVEEVEFEEELRIYLELDKESLNSEDDSLVLSVTVIDDFNNKVVLDDVDTSSMFLFSAVQGLVSAYTSESEEENSVVTSKSLLIYTYPFEIDSAFVDTISVLFVYNNGNDTSTSSIEFEVKPLQSTVGSLPADYINLNMRTDTVYKSGAFWNMFVDAIVSDSLGNPVDNGVGVLFTIEDCSVDTSLVSLENVSLTGEFAIIGDNVAQIKGEAINVFTYDSKAIGATIVIKSQLVEDSTIYDFDTLVIPLPKEGLQLMAHNRSGGVILTSDNDRSTAIIAVTLRDAFNIPVPFHTIEISSNGGTISPNKYVYEDGKVVGSTPVERFEGTDVDTLPNPFSGITDIDGEVIFWINVDQSEKPGSEEINTKEINVVIEQKETQLVNDDFSFTVQF